MRLVVDANVVISALIADSKTRELIVTLEPDLLTSEVVHDEIRRTVEGRLAGGVNVLIAAIERFRMVSAGESTVEGVDVDTIGDYLAQTEVVFAVLFGSHARGTADGSSDVDVALRFPDEMDTHERFRLRNRIDASLQEYAEGFVDVSDIDSLPTPVAHAALRDGIVLVGDEQVVESYRQQVKRKYEATADERERERREFIDRLARGDT